MQVIIPKAIRERRLLRLIYDGRARTVEPHAFGLVDGKHEAMLGWQVSPPVRNGEHWHVFHLDRISGLRTLEEQFEATSSRQAPTELLSDIDTALAGAGPEDPSPPTVTMAENEDSARATSPQ